MKINQTELAKKTGVTQQMISAIILGKARPSWKLAKRLAAVTRTDPELWLDGSPEDIQSSVLNFRKIEDKAA